MIVCEGLYLKQNVGTVRATYRYVQRFRNSARRVCCLHYGPVRILYASYSAVMQQTFYRCSVSSLVTLGIATGIDSTGLSQSMNLVWHQPIRVCVSRILPEVLF